MKKLIIFRTKHLWCRSFVKILITFVFVVFNWNKVTRISFFLWAKLRKLKGNIIRQRKRNSQSLDKAWPTLLSLTYEPTRQTSHLPAPRLEASPLHQSASRHVSTNCDTSWKLTPSYIERFLYDPSTSWMQLSAMELKLSRKNTCSSAVLLILCTILLLVTTNFGSADEGEQQYNKVEESRNDDAPEKPSLWKMIRNAFPLYTSSPLRIRSYLEKATALLNQGQAYIFPPSLEYVFSFL